MDKKVFSKLSYGMYLVTTEHDGKINSLVVNTAFQVSSKVPMIAISISKDVFSHGLIQKSKKFSLSILNNEAPIKFIQELGFFSGRAKDKLAGLSIFEANGIPVIKDNPCAYMTAQVESEVDCETHTLFIAKILDSQILDESTPMDYSTYKSKKGGTPWQAPTFNVDKMKPKGAD